MKRKLLALLLSGLLAVTVAACGSETAADPAQPTQTTDPAEPSLTLDVEPEEEIESSPEKGEIHWGDSVLEVSEKETATMLDSSNSAISYKAEIYGESATLLYSFGEDDSLSNVHVIFQLDGKDSNSVNVYNSALQDLKDLYGEPSKDNAIAPSSSEIFVTTEWKTKEVEATLFTSSNSETDEVLISIDVGLIPEFEAEEVSVGETYTIPDLCEFTINYSTLKKEVNPPNPGSYYTYYPEEDGKTYIDLSISIKNIRTTKRRASEFGIVKAVCGDGYEYDGFSIIEESGGKDFTYTNITDVDPLETAVIHYLISIPNELADDQESKIELQLTILDNQYLLIVR